MPLIGKSKRSPIRGLTKESIKEVKRLKRAGLTDQDVAKMIGINNSVFSRHKRAGMRELERQADASEAVDEMFRKVEAGQIDREEGLREALRLEQEIEPKTEADRLRAELAQALDCGVANYKLDLLTCAKKHAALKDGRLAFDMLKAKDVEYGGTAEQNAPSVVVQTGGGDVVMSGHLTEEDYREAGNALTRKIMERKRLERAGIPAADTSSESSSESDS